MKIFLSVCLLSLGLLASARAVEVEGRFGGQPVIRTLPGVRSGAPLSLSVPSFSGVSVSVGVEGVETLPTLPEKGPAAPAALPAAVLPAAPAAEPRAETPEKPETPAAALPVLENVGAKIDGAGRSQGGDAGVAPVLDRTFDGIKAAAGVEDATLGAEQRAASLPPASARSAATPPAVPPAAGEKKTPRWYSIFPNLVTTGNLWSGLAAAYFASQGSVMPAVAAIIAANVFDALDGRTARALKVKNPLGIDYDSLADVVSFGAAPALLVFKAALLPALGFWGFPIAAVFASAGWFRLSRFNVGAHAEEAGTIPHKKSDSFTGLPIPGGAGVVLAAVLALPLLPAAAALPFAVGATLLSAAAMASRLPYPAFKKGGAKALVVPALAGIAAVAPLVALHLYSLIPAAIFGLYLASGPLVWLWEGASAAWKTEVKRKAFHQLLLLSIPAFLFLGPQLIVPVAAVAVTAIGLFDLIRLKVPAARPFFERWFGKIIRAKESDRMSGSFYVALGLSAVACAVVLLDLSPAIFVAAALALALGDAASPLVGLRFGFKPYKVMGTQRSVDGTAAGFAVVLAIGLALGFAWPAALGAAVVFSLVDVFPVKPDDNLWIPIAYAAALSIFGGF